MSLLIDALKQAEQARREVSGAAEEVFANETSIKLEPMIAPEPGPLAGKNAQETVPKAKLPPPEENRAAVKQMFESKRDTPNRLPLFLAIFALCCLAAGLAYLWWAMQPRSQITTGAIAQPMQPQMASDQKPSGQKQGEQFEPVLPPKATSTTPPHSGSEPRATVPAPPASQVAAPQAAFTVTNDAGTPPLSFGRSKAPANQAPSSLEKAYESYAQGNYAQAEQLYRERLHTDPKNADVLSALGTLALRAGRPEEARRFFRDALAADPKHEFARAQLLSLIAETDALNAESTLQTLLAEQPDSASLHFALGSLYAKTGRWKEAQNAFYQAYTLDTRQADILYNLAVSLDHLRQPRLARQFYEQAASATQSGVASFDPALAQRRALQLGAQATVD